jgi:hypothetical protein
MSEAAFHTLTVAEVIDETSSAHSVVFEVSPELAQVFRTRQGSSSPCACPATGPAR